MSAQYVTVGTLLNKGVTMDKITRQQARKEYRNLDKQLSKMVKMGLMQQNRREPRFKWMKKIVSFFKKG